MTAKKSVAIECDECHEAHAPAPNTAQARYEATRDGWVRRTRDGKSIDLCVDCEKDERIRERALKQLRLLREAGGA